MSAPALSRPPAADYARLENAYLVPLAEIMPSPFNPRKDFDADGIAELALSIREHGLMQPITLRELTEMDYAAMTESERETTRSRYWIVAGERRWRACLKLGMESIPAIIQPIASEIEHRQKALIENVQRADLNPIEEAQAYQQLRQLGLGETAIAAKVNRSQPSIANAMRLLKLPQHAQQLVRDGQLSRAHGVAIASWAEWPDVAARIAEMAAELGWTSKQTENPPIPAYDLEHHPVLKVKMRVVRPWSVDFDVAANCHQCPFTAYRKLGTEHVCLNPSHFDGLQAEAAAAPTPAPRPAVPERYLSHSAGKPESRQIALQDAQGQALTELDAYLAENPITIGPREAALLAEHILGDVDADAIMRTERGHTVDLAPWWRQGRAALNDPGVLMELFDCQPEALLSFAVEALVRSQIMDAPAVTPWYVRIPELDKKVQLARLQLGGRPDGYAFNVACLRAEHNDVLAAFDRVAGELGGAVTTESGPDPAGEYDEIIRFTWHANVPPQESGEAGYQWLQRVGIEDPEPSTIVDPDESPSGPDDAQFLTKERRAAAMAAAEAAGEPWPAMAGGDCDQADDAVAAGTEDSARNSAISFRRGTRDKAPVWLILKFAETKQEKVLGWIGDQEVLRNGKPATRPALFNAAGDVIHDPSLPDGVNAIKTYLRKEWAAL